MDSCPYRGGLRFCCRFSEPLIVSAFTQMLLIGLPYFRARQREHGRTSNEECSKGELARKGDCEPIGHLSLFCVKLLQCAKINSTAALLLLEKGRCAGVQVRQVSGIEFLTRERRVY
jgi:hypothetical protein